MPRAPDGARENGFDSALRRGGLAKLFERRGPDVQDALRRLEARLAELLRRRAPAHPDLLAAALLGAAAAVVSRAHADGRVVDADALAAAL